MAHWHGKAQHSKFDRLFKFMSTPDFANSDFGDVEAPCGAVSVIVLTSTTKHTPSDIVSHGYNLTSDEVASLGELGRGTYVTVVDSNGLIWVFFYDKDDAEMQRWLTEDLKNAAAEYNQWELA